MCILSPNLISLGKLRWFWGLVPWFYSQNLAVELFDSLWIVWINGRCEIVWTASTCWIHNGCTTRQDLGWSFQHLPTYCKVPYLYWVIASLVGWMCFEYLWMPFAQRGRPPVHGRRKQSGALHLMWFLNAFSMPFHIVSSLSIFSDAIKSSRFARHGMASFQNAPFCFLCLKGKKLGRTWKICRSVHLSSACCCGFAWRCQSFMIFPCIELRYIIGKIDVCIEADADVRRDQQARIWTEERCHLLCVITHPYGPYV